MTRNARRGFGLIELLMIIAIVGILAGIVLSNVSKARERAQIAKAVVELRETAKVLLKYRGDTDVYPSECMLACSAGSDPFVNDLGVVGWAGPYGMLYGRTHPWGGHFGISDAYDIDGGGNDYVIVLDDDRPGSNDLDNGGQVPSTSLLAIDTLLDDGDLATGNIRGDGAVPTAVGELMMKVVW